jgi:hypothetical protein
LQSTGQPIGRDLRRPIDLFDFILAGVMFERKQIARQVKSGYLLRGSPEKGPPPDGSADARGSDACFGKE